MPITQATKSQINQVVLLILDGWGLGPEDESNPIYLAKTPYLDSLYHKYSWTQLCASGRCVGLPQKQVGNSEAGHENIGAGRVIDQDVVKISKEISTGQFFKNSAFTTVIRHVKKNKSALHIIGLLSNGQSPHSDPDHLLALLTLARKQGLKQVYLHLFTDGRDSPPRSALKSVMQLEKILMKNEKIASIMGRFYAMDRKKSWDRTILAFNTMAGNSTRHKAQSAEQAIEQAYNANVTDEFIEPTVIYQQTKPVCRIEDKDGIIFFNLRSDRARQLAKPFVQKNFEKLNPKAPKRKKIYRDIVFVAMTDFGPDLDSIYTAYPSEDLIGTLTCLLVDRKQVYIAEREKYAHMTYFFNGGYDHPIAGEDRIYVPSPDVRSYAQTPEMSTAEITQHLLAGLDKYDFLGVNIACPDMVGHTGDIQAGIKTAQAVDGYVKQIAEACLKKNAILIITADHGNLEKMLNLETKEIFTEHTTNPVPFIVVSHQYGRKLKLNSQGYLSNIAPTILKLMQLKPGKLMNKPLF